MVADDNRRDCRIYIDVRAASRDPIGSVVATDDGHNCRINKQSGVTNFSTGCVVGRRGFFLWPDWALYPGVQLN